MPTKTEHRETYKGRRIEVKASESRPGGWSYSWALDGGVLTFSRGFLRTTAEAALRAGIAAAQAKVDCDAKS